jgi:O-antigen ligase
MLASALAGRFIASGHISAGIAIVLSVSYIPLALFDLPVALAVATGLFFIEQLPVLSIGPSAIEAVLLFAWLGTFALRGDRPQLLREHRRLVTVIVLFAGWLTMSIGWAEQTGRASDDVLNWWIAALVFVVVSTTLRSPRDVVVVAVGLVAGAVASVAIGLAGLDNSLDPAAAAKIGGRFTGGGGDPNTQAAAFVAALFLAGGLLNVFRRPVARIGLLLSLALVMGGFFATQSRGGLLALGAATFAALVVARGQRARILGLVTTAAAGLALWVSTNPAALSRITDFGGGGSGREDQWTIAWRIFKGHPLIGIGLNNFQAVEARFTLQPGRLTHVNLLAEVQEGVHNTYLQLLAETGVIGLVAFLAVVIGSLRCSLLAARRFDAIGQPRYANISRAVLMGTIGMLAALFFLSVGNDDRLWVLFALGPALLAVARRWPDKGHELSPRRRDLSDSLGAARRGEANVVS